MKIRLTDIGSSRFRLELIEESGYILKNVDSGFTTEKTRSAAEYSFNLPKGKLDELIDNPGEYSYRPIDSEDFRLLVRGIFDTEDTANYFADIHPMAAFADAINAPTAARAPVIRWKGTNRLAVIDFDALESDRWDTPLLMAYIDTLSIKPSAAWVSGGGGVKMVFYRQNDIDADEIASIAAINLSSKPHRQIEIKSETRHPLYVDDKGRRCGMVIEYDQTITANAFREWMEEISTDQYAIQDWLQSKGLNNGNRFSHDYCPISPSIADNRNPVIVGDNGVYCHSCAARGNGFLPYYKVVGKRSETIVHTLIKSVTHWTHAKHILSAVIPFQEKVLRCFYSAALKLSHPIELRTVIDSAFSIGLNLLRIRNGWTSINGKSYSREVSDIIEALPSTRLKGKVDKERKAILLQTHDLTSYGYPSLHPVYGFPIAFHHLGADNLYPYTVYPDELNDLHTTQYRPIFEPKSRRMAIAESTAWAMIDDVFPGINRSVVKLLIAARGVSDLRQSMQPILFFSGPTGAGKSTIVHISAAICGDKNAEQSWDNDQSRIREGVMKAAETGGFITLNEIVKEATKAIGNPNPFSILLGLTPDTTTWKLYNGNVPMGALPVIILTDISVPKAMAEDAQLGRRIIHVPIEGSRQWDITCMRAGVFRAQRLRISRPELAKACDIILSSVVDEFFQDRQTIFDIANKLGFKAIAEGETAAEMRDMLLRFFRTYQKTKSVDPQKVKQIVGNGWRLIKRQSPEDLSIFWNQLKDEGPNGFFASQRIAEQDWAKLLNSPKSIHFFTKKIDEESIAIRFSE